MPQEVVEGTLLWEPSEAVRSRANLTRYMAWLREARGLGFETYGELWQWSVTDLDGFWSSIWEFFEVRAHRPYTQVLAERRMPGARLGLRRRRAAFEGRGSRCLPGRLLVDDAGLDAAAVAGLVT